MGKYIQVKIKIEIKYIEQSARIHVKEIKYKNWECSYTIDGDI